MKTLMMIIALAVLIPAYGQENTNSFSTGLIIKTSLFSLVAQRPTITIEKMLPNRWSVEAAFVQGEFNNLIGHNHYTYSGYLSGLNAILMM